MWTELDQLYARITDLKSQNIMVTTYGCDDNRDTPDADILCDFMEYIYHNHPSERPDWMEAFYQILCWQFQSFHEGVATYYENFYGLSDDLLLTKTVRFLWENGYREIAEKYQQGRDAYICCPYPDGKREDGKKADIREIDTWINWHTEVVWKFCLDVLEQNKAEWKKIR
ncbi:MAG: hypothetical protein IKM28_06775 [Lachnospiraceae bacterium]|nr:hypothetical protein [Lachnospiraceae bacterium]